MRAWTSMVGYISSSLFHCTYSIFFLLRGKLTYFVTMQLLPLHGLWRILGPPNFAPSHALQAHSQAPPQVDYPYAVLLTRVPPRRRIFAICPIPSLHLPLPSASDSVSQPFRLCQLLEHLRKYHVLIPRRLKSNHLPLCRSTIRT